MFSNGLLLFLLLLVPLSGFIAWGGDFIGHRIGKRRHTLWNLRPRHTATLVTIGAGMCVSLVSLGLMWSASETFRIVLREGANLLQSNESLRGENRALQTRNADDERTYAARIARLNGAREQAERDVKSALAAKRLAQNKLSQSQQQYGATKRELTTARGSVKTAQSELQRETKQLERAQGDLTTTRDELKEKRTRVAQAQQNVADAKRRLLQTQRSLQKAQLQVMDAAKRMFSLDERVKRIAGNAEAAIQLQKKNLDELKASVRVQNERLAEQQADFERKRLELNRVTMELDTQRKAAERLFGQSLTTTTALRQGRITFQIGDELARVAIESTTSPFRTRIALEKLLDRAAEAAERRGARKGDQSRAAVILPRAIRDENAISAEPRLIQESDAVQATTMAIGEAHESVVVVAVAVANTVAGEAVPMEIHTYRNPLVLAAGATVGEITINGDDDRQRVLDALYTFLRRDVRKKLLSLGVIPPLVGNDGDEEGEGARADGASNLVTLSGEEWLRIIGAVRDVDGPARVTVRAAKNLRAADAVALTFEVRPVYPLPTTQVGQRN